MPPKLGKWCEPSLFNSLRLSIAFFYSIDWNIVYPLSKLTCVIVAQDGLTPLHCAARSGHDPALEILLERGAPILARTKVASAWHQLSSISLHKRLCFTLLSRLISAMSSSSPSCCFLCPPASTPASSHRTDCRRCTCRPRGTTWSV